MVTKISGLLAFSVQKKTKFVPRYNKIKSVTHLQRNYGGKHQRPPPSSISILLWIQNFPDRGTVEI